jgi:hypothetical protein
MVLQLLQVLHHLPPLLLRLLLLLPHHWWCFDRGAPVLPHSYLRDCSRPLLLLLLLLLQPFLHEPNPLGVEACRPYRTEVAWATVGAS